MLAVAFSDQLTLGNLITIVALSVVLVALFAWLVRSLRVVVHDAGDSISAMNAALARVEILETRINAAEHRLAVVERYQIRVMDAEASLRGAGINVPWKPTEPPTKPTAST